MKSNIMIDNEDNLYDYFVSYIFYDRVLKNTILVIKEFLIQSNKYNAEVQTTLPSPNSLFNSYSYLTEAQAEQAFQVLRYDLKLLNEQLTRLKCNNEEISSIIAQAIENKFKTEMQLINTREENGNNQTQKGEELNSSYKYIFFSLADSVTHLINKLNSEESHFFNRFNQDHQFRNDFETVYCTLKNPSYELSCFNIPVFDTLYERLEVGQSELTKMK